METERLRSHSRAVRSRVVGRVGWQGWANDGVRSIYSKTSASEAGSRSSSLQLASLSRICSAYQETSAAECKSAAEAFKALWGSAPGHTDSGVKPATFKEGLVSLPDPCSWIADRTLLTLQMVLTFELARTLKLGGIGAGDCAGRESCSSHRPRVQAETSVLCQTHT